MNAQPKSLLVGERSESAVVPRAKGEGFLSTKVRDRKTVVSDFRCSGALRMLFPRCETDLEAILINTSGGLTSGDVISTSAHAGTGSKLTLSTQAAERAYRANNGPAIMRTELSVEDGAWLNWLPQEMILFDHCNIKRSLNVNLAASAKFLMVEPVVFGRTAMGEAVQSGSFHDSVTIHRAGVPLFMDRTRLDGAISKSLARAAISRRRLAMASLVYVGPNAEVLLADVRAMLPNFGGASLIHHDVLTARILAADSFELRKSLLPILDFLSRHTLPKTWRL